MQALIKNSFSTIIGCVFILIVGLSSTLKSQTVQSAPKDVATPVIQAKVAVSNTCQSGKTCGSWVNSMKKVNSVTITNLSATWYPSLEYTIYDNINGTGKIVSTVVCNQSNVTFATAKLINAKTFSVKLKDVNSSNSMIYNFKNASFNGKICGDDDGGGEKLK